MPSIVVALLLAAAAAAPRHAAPVSAGTHPAGGARPVVTAEGVRFELPAGFDHSTEEREGRRFDVSKSPDGSAALAVAAFSSNTALPCEGDQAGARVEAFRTSRGLPACSVSGEADGGALALVFVKASDTLVAITGIGAAKDLLAIARSVANSVVVGPATRRTKLPRLDVPERDDRIFGCFQKGETTRIPTATLNVYRDRCFSEDFTFTEKFSAGMTMPQTNVYGDDLGDDHLSGRRGRSGTWWYADGTLVLELDDGEAMESSVEFAGDDLVLDGERWRRD